MKLDDLDIWMLDKLERNGVYSKKARSTIVSKAEARMYLRMPKEILNPKIEEWEEKGVISEKQGNLHLTSFWRELSGLPLNKGLRKSSKRLYLEHRV